MTERTHAVPWFQGQRLAWIGEMLHIYGFINREHLQRKFWISTPQASKDLQRFALLHPETMRYDLSRKCYVVRPTAVKGQVRDR